MGRTFLSLGSNVGSRDDNLHFAISRLDSRFKRLDISDIYQTAPQDYFDQDDFYNLVACYDIGETEVYDLLDFIHIIENEMGRLNFRQILKGPRPIDIDIIYIDDFSCAKPDLTIPHLAYLNRNFVLVPLRQLLNNFCYENDAKWLEQINNHINENSSQKVQVLGKF